MSVGFLSIYVGDAKLIRLFLFSKLEESHKVRHTQVTGSRKSECFLIFNANFLFNLWSPDSDLVRSYLIATVQS